MYLYTSQKAVSHQPFVQIRNTLLFGTIRAEEVSWEGKYFVLVWLQTSTLRLACVYKPHLPFMVIFDRPSLRQALPAPLPILLYLPSLKVWLQIAHRNQTIYPFEHSRGPSWLLA